MNTAILRPVEDTSRCRKDRENEAVNIQGPPSYTLPDSSPPASSHRDRPTTQHGSAAAPPSMLASPEASQSSPRSLDLVRSAAAHLLDLGGSCSAVLPMLGASTPDGHDALRVDGPQSSEASPASDGVFLPGSAYLEFHSALRHHTFNAARSAVPSRCGTPESAARPDAPGRDGLQEDCGPSLAVPRPDVARLPLDDATLLSAVPTPASLELTQQQEYELWKNWVDEIAPWVRPPLVFCP